MPEDDLPSRDGLQVSLADEDWSLKTLAELQEIIMYASDQSGKIPTDEWKEIHLPRIRKAQEIIRSREAE